MDLIFALVNANRDFEMFLYPNKNHGIYGGYIRYHLYNKMTILFWRIYKIKV